MEFLWMAVAGSIAFAKARSTIIWGFLGYAIGWPAAFIVMFLSVKVKRWEQRLETLQDATNKLEQFNRPKEYEDFNTVDDLMKQLEKK
jgi:hypothetical protein